MPQRVINFNPGPAALPLPVLEQVQAELLDFEGTGMSILESSHRAPAFDAVNTEAQALLRRLMGLPEGYQVLFLQGGASLQFAMLPMNLLGPDQHGDYVNTGVWSGKAIKEAEIVGRARLAGSGEAEGFRRIPEPDEVVWDPAARYAHYTSNNTIYGTQWHRLPEVGDLPLICDMSSDILSRPIEAARYAMIYAGAQKNLGPSGLTVVIIRDDLVEAGRADIPSMLQYRIHAAKRSLYNTPNTFGIYCLWRCLQHVERLGGVPAVEAENRAKQALLYATIDASEGFYRGTADPASRSWMNATLRLPDEALEQRFVAEAAAAGMVGLKGHRSAGGIRVSMYNAVPLAGVERLVDFMQDFKRRG
ncbi:MAG: 3-phosphoserine/phosphohydroxythreonine transaminase [Caldilineae bacterium]|nr:3-phosphoserine/phosphohydroxythreonine transaminase [Chloroflexota bacterium]MCB9176580.1 3-phosphoserine/phosphohydroxythreonine transaminase [Caldilineae bacterium]